MKGEKMPYIDYSKSKEVTLSYGKRIAIDDDKITIESKKLGETCDWGDEDVSKLVTDVIEMTVIINASVVDKFDGIARINMIRYGYYNPCYNTHSLRNQEITKMENGDLKVTMR